MKLTIVGGGSTYTPELIDGFARHPELGLSDLTLVDPNQERLDLVGGMAKRMLQRAGSNVTVTQTSDLVEGVTDADAVLIQLRVGGQTTRHEDETWPHQVHCLGQETTGPGGLAKALRTVPIVLDIADKVRRHAKPDAWIIDFTNPLGIVTRALLNHGHRAVGLCNVAIGFQRRFADTLGVQPAQVALGHVGLNHLTWETSVHVDGQDVLPKMLSTHLEEIAEEVELPPSLLTMLSSVPSYYLRYYYAHDEVLAEQLREPSRAAAVQQIEDELLHLYADPRIDTKPDILSERGGAFYSEAAVELMLAIRGQEDLPRVVNLRNDGMLPFLPDDHVVEVPAKYEGGIFVPEPIDPLPADVTGLISAVAGYERLALDAAIHGGRQRVVRAMMAHPLVLQYDRAERLTDLLLTANARFLPWT